MPVARRLILQVLVVGPILLLPPRAEPAPHDRTAQVVTVDQVIAMTLDRSPLVKEIEASFAARRADAFDARTLPNPELSAEIASPAGGEVRGDDELTVALVQPFRLSHGKPRDRLARLMEASGARDKERALLELFVRARLAFARAWVLSERTKVLDALRPQALSLTRSIQSGVKEGLYGQGDEALFRAEAFRIEAALKALSAEALLAAAELSKLSGASYAGATFSRPPVPDLPELDGLRKKLAHSESRAQQRAKLVLDLARLDDEVARRDAFPELRPRFSYGHTNEGVDLVGIGVSFDLPFQSRNTAERLRKESARRAAEAGWNMIQGETFQQAVLSAARAAAFRAEELVLYEKKILPAMNEAFHAAQTQVKSAQGSVPQLWQTLREYGESHERYLELWTRAFADRLELSLILEEDL